MSRRILFVIDSLFPLGPAFQLKILADVLSESGDEVHIAAFNEVWETQLACQFPAAKVYGLNKGIIRGSRQAVLAPRLRKLIRAIEPKFVHAWCESATTICGLALVGLDQIRFVCTELWETPEKSLLQYLAQQRFYKRADAIAVPHESLKSHLVEEYDRREHRLRVINNAAVACGQDRAVSRSLLLDRIGVPADSKIAGTSAPFIARTRLKDLIWATDLLTCVRDDVHFVIFGQGGQEARLRRFLSLTEAIGHVHFLGNDPDVRSLINGIDFYWHSHLREPLPTGLLFAMANGIPVVSVYGPQTEDVIVPQTTGLAVNFGARDEFARWTKYLIELPDAASQLARQGREHVLQHFPAERMVNDYLEIYEQVPASA